MASSSQVCDCVHEHGWDSAFYRFAESIRDLTCGGCNHKHIYALVGTRGRYINHTNPIVRKRTAAALSRLMHSSRYAADMRKGYADDSSVFSRAAASLIDMLRNATDLDDAGLFDFVLHTSWPELLRGLESERRAGREIDPLRMACESREVVRWGEQQAACGRAPLAELLAACFRTMAFGCLDDRFARTLCSRTPQELQAPPDTGDGRAQDGACLVRVADGDGPCVLGVWCVDADRPFSIGRFSSCDAIEADPVVSRLHCRVFMLDGTWFLEDGGSTHGTRVLRDAGGGPACVFDSGEGDGPRTFPLEFGDRIVLAGRSTYWFCARDAHVLTIG